MRARRASRRESAGSRLIVGVLVALACSSAELARADQAASPAPPASAAPGASPEAIAIAESLFADGRALLAAERFEEAAAKFQASHEAAPSATALLNQGICLERLGRTASAWAAYKSALKLANQTAEEPKIAKAKELLAGVEPNLSSIRVRAASPPPGLVLRRGAAVLGGVAVLDTKLPVDPGTFELRAEAPGHAPYAREVELAPGAALELEVPPLEPVRDEVPTSPEAEGVSPWLVGGAVAGGVGVVAVAVGATLGGLVLAEEAALLDDPTLCPDHACSSEGLARVDDARTLATASTALLVGGGVLAAGGAALVVITLVSAPPLAPSSARALVLPWLSPRVVGLAAGGAF